MQFTFSASEPGVPYNVTVRARTAAGLGEPVSIVVFVVQQGNYHVHMHKGILDVPYAGGTWQEQNCMAALRLLVYLTPLGRYL